MKRLALILANPGEAGAPNYCEGVNLDVEAYSQFLRANFGGAWYSSEIDVLKRPSVAQARLALGKLKGVDYGLVIFAGHGEYITSKKTTVLELRRGEEIDSLELRSGASKQTVVLDCCRSIAPESKRAVVFAEAMQKRADTSADSCRFYYEKRISECPSSVSILWACTIGETAGDDRTRGGYYSLGLLDESENWAKNSTTDVSKNYSILSVVEAHDKATPTVLRLSGERQHPTIEKVRSGPYFPFAVVA